MPCNGAAKPNCVDVARADDQLALNCRRRSSISTTIQANKVRKIDIKKQGLNTIQNKVVRNNLMGISESMTKKDWKDSQGRKGKVPPPLPLPS